MGPLFFYTVSTHCLCIPRLAGISTCGPSAGDIEWAALHPSRRNPSGRPVNPTLPRWHAVRRLQTMCAWIHHGQEDRPERPLITVGEAASWPPYKRFSTGVVVARSLASLDSSTLDQDAFRARLALSLLCCAQCEPPAESECISRPCRGKWLPSDSPDSTKNPRPHHHPCR